MFGISLNRKSKQMLGNFCLFYSGSHVFSSLLFNIEKKRNKFWKYSMLRSMYKNKLLLKGPEDKMILCG